MEQYDVRYWIKKSDGYWEKRTDFFCEAFLSKSDWEIVRKMWRDKHKNDEVTLISVDYL